MKILLVPKLSFDRETKKSIKTIVSLSEEIMKKEGIPLPRSLEFFNSFDEFRKRVLKSVMDYGFSRKIAENFINASFETGTYGTYDFRSNSIIEMNFNPFYRLFYPAIQFFRFVIHESSHLFLRKSLGCDIEKYKFNFVIEKNKIEYKGRLEVLQLDEGFAEIVTNLFMKKIDVNEIRTLPIYSAENEAPKYEKKVDNVHIPTLVKFFDKFLQRNKKIGYHKVYYIIRKNFRKMEYVNVCDLVEIVSKRIRNKII